MTRRTARTARRRRFGRANWRARLHDIMRRGVHFGEDKLPPGSRLFVGVLLMGGGVLGFLPILGFWMLPLGVIIAALDIPPLRRRLLAKYPKPVTDAGTAPDKERHPRT